VAATMPTVGELADLRERLAAADASVVDTSAPDTSAPDECTAHVATCVDLLTELERIKSACAAAQARLSVSLDASLRSRRAAEGVRAADQGRGIASQIALARHDSPVKGQRHLGLAKALVREMPHTLRALAIGDISEWRATLIVRETATLSPEHRSAVDAALADRLPTLGDGGVSREARKLAYQLDPGAALRRSRGARADRHVSVRPAPDTMTYLTGFLPVEQGVAVHAALSKHADARRAAGDDRSRGQIMADTLVERVTGQSEAPAVPTAIQLVMTDGALLGQSDAPARVHGYGPIPASLARSISRAAAEAAKPAAAWLQRLYTSPRTGELVAMESRRRAFGAGLRTFLVARDEVCRTPWCDAPIRHADHPVRVADGGETSATNGQGLCESCNQTNESPGWSATVSRAGPRHRVTVHTPTGHSYDSTPPDLPREPRRPQPRAADVTSPLERRLAALVAAA
jgi:hypothetical protein